MAIAFVLEHPAISAAIIGPRTMEQLESQLGAPEVVLEHRGARPIDAIVDPGTNLNAADAGWSPRVLGKASFVGATPASLGVTHRPVAPSACRYDLRGRSRCRTR